MSQIKTNFQPKQGTLSIILTAAISCIAYSSPSVAATTNARQYRGTLSEKVRLAAMAFKTEGSKEQPGQAVKDAAKGGSTAGSASTTQESDAQESVEQKALAETKNNLDSAAKDSEGTSSPIHNPAEKEKWMNLMDYIATQGTQQESIMGLYTSVSKITPKTNPAGELAQHFSLVGGPGSNGEPFYISRIEVVNEDWTNLEPGKRRVDQWMFLLSRDGSIARVMRFHMIRLDDGHVLEHNGVDFTQEEAQKKWDDIRSQWYEISTK